MARAIRVKAREAEKVRKFLVSEGLLDRGHRARKEGGFVYFPVLGRVPGYRRVGIRMPRTERGKGFREALSGLLGGEAEGAVFSYDVVGDIAILEVPEKFLPRARKIGELLLHSDRKLNAVFRKAGGRKGKYRITPLVHLAGEERTETVHTENGVKMKVDLAREYFTPRLATERKRIAGLVEDGEKVLVLFAGVGPFALAIAKEKDAEVVGVELNPSAVEHFRENARMNRLRGSVSVVEGDAGEVVPEKFRGFADRVLMPLPRSAEGFLREAIMAAKSGGMVHFYSLVEKEGGLEKAKGKVLAAAEKEGREIEFLRAERARPFSAAKEQVVIDFRCS